MELRIIKNDKQYRRYLNEVEKLAARDPDLKSKDGGRLELLAKLIEDYEKERFKFDKPDLSAVRSRAAEPSMAYEAFLKKLKADGTL